MAERYPGSPSESRTDVYNPRDTSLTRPSIEILREHGLGFCVLTKAGTRALLDAHLYRPERDAFASMLTAHDDRSSKKWERNAALPGDRVAASAPCTTAGSSPGCRSNQRSTSTPGPFYSFSRCAGVCFRHPMADFAHLPRGFLPCALTTLSGTKRPFDRCTFGPAFFTVLTGKGAAGRRVLPKPIRWMW